MQGDAAKGDARDVQQIIEQGAHALHLPLDGLATALPLFGRGLGRGDQRRRLANGGQRIAQFMGQHGEEFVLLPVVVAQLLLLALALADVEKPDRHVAVEGGGADLQPATGATGIGTLHFDGPGRLAGLVLRTELQDPRTGPGQAGVRNAAVEAQGGGAYGVEIVPAEGARGRGHGDAEGDLGAFQGHPQPTLRTQGGLLETGAVDHQHRLGGAQVGQALLARRGLAGLRQVDGDGAERAVQGTAQGHGMQGGEAQAVAQGGQGGEPGCGRQRRHHHPGIAAQHGGTGAFRQWQGDQLRLIFRREAGREIQLRRLAVFQQRDAAQGRLVEATEDREDLLQLLRQRGQLQQTMIEPLQDLQVCDLQLQLLLAQLQAAQIVVAFLFDQPAGFGSGQQRFAHLADLQHVAVGQRRRQALPQGLGRLLQRLHRPADPPRQQQGHRPGEDHRQHQAAAIEREGAIGGCGHLFGGDRRGHGPAGIGQAHEGRIDLVAFPGTGGTDAFFAGLGQDLGQTWQGRLAQAFLVQAGTGDAQAMAIEYRAHPVPGQGAGHARRPDALRCHHRGQHEIQPTFAQHRDPDRKGQQPGGSAAQLPDHRPALGEHLGKAVRFGERPTSGPVDARYPPDDLALRRGEQHRSPTGHQRQDAPDQGVEIAQVTRPQQGRLGQRLENGHRTAQFAFDDGGGLATGLQGSLFGFVLLVLDEQPEPQAGYQCQGHDSGEGNGQQAIAQGDQTRRAKLRRQHGDFD